MIRRDEKKVIFLAVIRTVQ